MDEPDIRSGSAPRPLPPLPPRPSSALSPDAARRIGKAAVVGSLVGFLAFTAAVGLLGWAIGFDLGGSIALGAFTGFWGGPGFGGMMAGTLAVARQHAAEVGH